MEEKHDDVKKKRKKNKRGNWKNRDNVEMDHSENINEMQK